MFLSLCMFCGAPNTISSYKIEFYVRFFIKGVGLYRLVFSKPKSGPWIYNEHIGLAH